MCVLLYIYIEAVAETPSVLLGRVGGVVDGDLVVAGVVRVGGKVHRNTRKHGNTGNKTKRNK